METYETDTEIPSDEPEIIVQTSWAKTITLCIMMTVIGAGLALAVVALGLSPQFVNDQDCDAMVLDAMNQSFINGTAVGMEYTIASITQEAVQCKTMPMKYANYSYTLVATECLNLNKTEEQ